MTTPVNWYAATAAPSPACPALTDALDTQVCVIGGGYTGVGAALHLARSGTGVALLEADSIGGGASGRNGGQVHVGMRRDQPWLEAKYGQERAHRLWRIALDARDFLDTACTTYGIDCGLTPGHLHLDHRARDVAHSHAHAEHMARHYDHALEPIGRAQARALVASDSYHGGVLDRRGGHLHALDWALGLARAARDEGAALFGQSPAVSLARHGARWRITTPHGSVTADAVILACNGYLRGLSTRVEAHVMPINNYIAVTEPLGRARAEALIGQRLAVSDSRFVVYYYRLTPDDRLLFGGGESYSLRFPDDIAAFVRPHMLRVFPQLAGVRIDHAWGGTLAVTTTRMPFVAEVEPGLFNVSGFSGLGVLLGPWLGKIAADRARGVSDDFDLLASIAPPAFPGGRLLRAPTLALAMTGAALLDRF